MFMGELWLQRREVETKEKEDEEEEIENFSILWDVCPYRPNHKLITKLRDMLQYGW